MISPTSLVNFPKDTKRCHQMLLVILILILILNELSDFNLPNVHIGRLKKKKTFSNQWYQDFDQANIKCKLLVGPLAVFSICASRMSFLWHHRNTLSLLFNVDFLISIIQCTFHSRIKQTCLCTSFICCSYIFSPAFLIGQTFSLFFFSCFFFFVFSTRPIAISCKCLLVQFFVSWPCKVSSCMLLLMLITFERD